MSNNETKTKSEPSKLKCMAEGCIYRDKRYNRNCKNWRPQTPCGFIDAGDERFISSNWFGSTYSIPDTEEEVTCLEDDTEVKANDMVDMPKHYEFIPPEDCEHSGWEVKDIIKIAVLKNFKNSTLIAACLYWQVLKYLLRCGCKGNMLQDLKKSEHYLKDLIKEVSLDANI